MVETQKETIVWHRYPEVKPKARSDKLYLIGWKSSIREKKPMTSVAYWNPRGKHFMRVHDFHPLINILITIWAEMPKGWK